MVGDGVSGSVDVAPGVGLGVDAFLVGLEV